MIMTVVRVAGNLNVYLKKTKIIKLEQDDKASNTTRRKKSLGEYTEMVGV